MKRNKKTQAHRYYLQNCLMPPLEVDGVTKLIKGPYPDFQSIPVGPRYVVGQLIRHGFNYQFKLLEVPETQEPARKPDKKPAKKNTAENKQLDLF